jgi:membrane-bound lytic murein transglycosylase D
MTIKRLITVALATVFISALSAEAQDNNVKKNRKSLEQENTELRAKMDSLVAELDRYRMELEVADSIRRELAEQEQMSETDEAQLSPEDYTAEVSDSLLSIWYLQKNTSMEEDIDMDSVKFESSVPDSVYMDRLAKMNSFIRLPYNDIVRNYIILYSEKMGVRIENILGLCSYYMPIFQETLNRYDLPEELKAMAIIESALNPTAVSRAGAKGMWQFMYGTAKMYGLHIDSFVDERLDPVKSADAAARYLRDAYNIFGDWNLAIASYNCGAGNVNRAIRRSGGSRAFWDIWPYLPRETRGYVPAFVGALYTMKYHKEHGIRPAATEMPVHVDTFKINKMLHFKQVYELAGVPMEQLKNLNPQYRHEIVPGNEREYILRIPYNYTNAFIDQEDTLYRHKADVYFNPATIKKIKDGGDGERIVYKVKSGDYLGKIASKYRVSVNQIKRWNNLKSNNIRVGQRLIIYRGGKVTTSSSSSAQSSSTATKTTAAKPASAQTSASKTSTVNPSAEYTVYTVQSGDSLYQIAKKFPGVSAQNIMDFNGIGSNIKPGMKIKIPKL